MIGTSARRIAAAIDGDRLWRRMMALAEIGATAGGGVNRQALSAEDRKARAWLAAKARERGFAVAQDRMANLFVRREGSDPQAAPVMVGSHLDSQPKGGKYDGAYGVMAAFEILETLEDLGIETGRALEAVAWTNEEGSRFQPGAVGSAVYAGTTEFEPLLDGTDWDGMRFGDELEATIEALADAVLRDPPVRPHAFLEAHIEQGPRLEAAGLQVGTVTGIQGIRRYIVRATGSEAHAGTTPRALRQDALMAAARMVLALDRAFAEGGEAVRFTVGRFDVEPGSPNTVPGAVAFTIDFRHPETAVLDDLGGRIGRICEGVAAPCGAEVRPISQVPPTRFPSEMVRLLQASAEAADLPYLEMFSGAGHDAMHLAAICPTAMVFVPCKDGISHNEAESATPADLAAGTRVLAGAAVELAL